MIRAGRERALNPDALDAVPGNFEQGLFTQGWIYQGFIEDRNGDLRPQSQEETLWCMGCHGGIGATTDTLFSFPRKLDAGSTYRHAWYHWSQRSLAGAPEPRRPDGRLEYAHYLRINGAGDELRANEEIRKRFFDPSGMLRPERLQALEADISTLLWPSRERALRLDKTYRTIVQDQTFNAGRDATLVPPENVHRSLNQGQPTGVTQVEL